MLESYSKILLRCLRYVFTLELRTFSREVGLAALPSPSLSPFLYCQLSVKESLVHLHYMRK